MGFALKILVFSERHYNNINLFITFLMVSRVQLLDRFFPSGGVKERKTEGFGKVGGVSSPEEAGGRTPARKLKPSGEGDFGVPESFQSRRAAGPA